MNMLNKSTNRRATARLGLGTLTRLALLAGLCQPAISMARDLHTYAFTTQDVGGEANCFVYGEISYAVTPGDIELSRDELTSGHFSFHLNGSVVRHFDAAEGAGDFRTLTLNGTGHIDFGAMEELTGVFEADEPMSMRLGGGGGAIGDAPGDACVFLGTWHMAAIQDDDSDGVPSATDNCSEIANPYQRDSDADGFGNACDADLDNNCIVDNTDLERMRSVFFSDDHDADINGDGIVNVIDFGAALSRYMNLPGPSAYAGCVLPAA